MHVKTNEFEIGKRMYHLRVCERDRDMYLNLEYLRGGDFLSLVEFSEAVW